MMKRYAVLGLGSFGKEVVEEMLQKHVELVLADRDEKALEEYKDRVMAVYVADLTSKTTLEQIMPASLDGCVIDFGDNTEASLLVTHYLRQLGQTNIMVLGRSASHGEILRLLGAETVVNPATEAARRMVPRLLNNGLLSYTPLGRGLSFAEIPLPKELVGLSLREARFRERFNLNIIAARTDDQARQTDQPSPGTSGREAEIHGVESRGAPNRGTAVREDDSTDDEFDSAAAEKQQYRTLAADYVLKETDILLVSGSDEAISTYGSALSRENEGKGSWLLRMRKKK